MQLLRVIFESQISADETINAEEVHAVSKQDKLRANSARPLYDAKVNVTPRERCLERYYYEILATNITF